MSTDNKINVSIKELYKKEPLSFEASMIYHQLRIHSDDFEQEGITVSVKVPYPLWCTDEKALLKNKEAYESIDTHRHLFTFVSTYGICSIEELADNPYNSWTLWIKIKDRSSCGENRLIITHGNAPDRKEAYYRAKDYEDFWNVVERLTEMYDNVDNNKEYEPIVLNQNNGMCGSSYKEWKLQVNK